MKTVAIKRVFPFSFGAFLSLSLLIWGIAVSTRAFTPNLSVVTTRAYAPQVVKATRDISDQVFPDDECQDLCDAWAEESDNDFGAPMQHDSQPPLQQTDNRQDTVRRANKSDEIARRLRRKSLTTMSRLMPSPRHCDTCGGDGSESCRFCGGTSFLSGIGGETDALFADGIGISCPVCDDGLELCHQCAGTGSVFSWGYGSHVSTGLHNRSGSFGP